MKELNEMTIGRTDDPENPLRVSAFEAAGLFGAGSRTPSGPAVMPPRQQAGHMIAIDILVKVLSLLLNPRGRPHMHEGRPAPVSELRRTDEQWHGPWSHSDFVHTSWFSVFFVLKIFLVDSGTITGLAPGTRPKVTNSKNEMNCVILAGHARG